MHEALERPVLIFMLGEYVLCALRISLAQPFGLP